LIRGSDPGLSERLSVRFTNSGSFPFLFTPK